MSEWKKVKIGEFLNQYRNTIYVEDDKDYGQITISKHDGVQFRGNKKGKNIGRKRQFLIDLITYPNTLIFTRQGVADGSIGFAPESINGCIATENMPMFSIDERIILKEYFSLILKSDIFMDEVAEITPTGSAQKSIHENQLLQLEITIPKTIEEQKRIVKELISKIEKVDSTLAEIDKQKSYAKQLRQSILQDAIEGKLTADWRKAHPVKKGNPDYDAEALFQKIQEEKEKQATGKKRSNEKFATISDKEKPFQIPTGWKWVRLGEIIRKISTGPFGTMLHQNEYIHLGIPIINPTNIINSKISLEKAKCVSQVTFNRLRKYKMHVDDLVLARRGDLSKIAIVQSSINILCGTGSFFMRLYSLDLQYFILFYTCHYAQEYLLQDSIGQTMDNLNQKLLSKLPISLPPIAEQTEIVRRVETQLSKITQLEQQIATREELTKQLMRGILRDAFEGER